MTDYLADAIDQADWMTEESSYNTVDELYQTDPDLFVNLAREWREEHPMANLGG